MPKSQTFTRNDYIKTNNCFYECITADELVAVFCLLVSVHGEDTISDFTSNFIVQNDDIDPNFNYTLVSLSDIPNFVAGKSMNFGKALEQVKDGMGMRLPKWEPDVVIRARYPDDYKNLEMTAPYLYVESRFGKVPWKETMIELFSDLWEVVE